MKKFFCLLLAALMLFSLTACVPKLSDLREELLSEAPEVSPSPSPLPSPSPEATIDPSMVLSEEEIAQMAERAKTAVVTEDDINYFLDGAYPIMMDTQNLATLLLQVDTDNITPENTSEWKPLLQQISDEASALSTRFSALTPTENFADFQRLMILGYDCYVSSMDLLIESEGEDIPKMFLAVDYMLQGNACINGANSIMSNMPIE